MSKFSERIGATKPKTAIQVESIDNELINSLWNALSEIYWDKGCNRDISGRPHKPTYELFYFFKLLWARFFKEPTDALYYSDWDNPYTIIRARFFEYPWEKVYDFIEFCANNYPNEEKNNKFLKAVNYVLERELSGYRFIGKQVCPIINKDEISEIEKSLSSPLKPIRLHFENAVKLMSNKISPDYRNSIKESISAVESICRIILGDKNITLGKALDKLEKTGNVKIQKALREAFDHLYGFTSGSEGIRHAMGLLEEPHLDLEEATFMLVSCSAFVNYLTIKADKSGIKIN